MKRIGLTMRIVHETAYSETRDALAHDWARFLSAALPDCQWIPLPNLSEAATSIIHSFGIEALIFTGGNDPGGSPMRDTTEKALLHEAMNRQIPVFGVCRGLQMIHWLLGGSLRPCSKQDHVGSHHEVRFLGRGSHSGARVVNSYHTLGVHPHDLASELKPHAMSPDGWVEALIHRNAPISAVQWHPERNAVIDTHDTQLLRETFGLPALTSLTHFSGTTTTRSSTLKSTSPCAP